MFGPLAKTDHLKQAMTNVPPNLHPSMDQPMTTQRHQPPSNVNIQLPNNQTPTHKTEDDVSDDDMDGTGTNA